MYGNTVTSVQWGDRNKRINKQNEGPYEYFFSATLFEMYMVVKILFSKLEVLKCRIFVRKYTLSILAKEARFSRPEKGALQNKKIKKAYQKRGRLFTKTKRNHYECAHIQPQISEPIIGSTVKFCTV